MGCQNSQVSDLAPQDPHVLEEGNPPQPQIHPESSLPTLDSKPPQKEGTPLARHGDKENLKPAETPAKKHQESGKWQENPSSGISEDKKKSKSERIVDEMPIVDATNHLKENLVMVDKKMIHNRESKRLSSMSVREAEAEPSVGPSSKSIQVTEPLKQNTGEEAFPITNILKQPENPSLKIVEDTSPKLISQQPGPSEKVELKPFVLQHWQKTEHEEKTDRQMKDILKNEVQSYLEQIWAYEWEMVDAVVAKMEEKEHKKYQ